MISNLAYNSKLKANWIGYIKKAAFQNVGILCMREIQTFACLIRSKYWAVLIDILLSVRYTDNSHKKTEHFWIKSFGWVRLATVRWWTSLRTSTRLEHLPSKKQTNLHVFYSVRFEKNQYKNFSTDARQNRRISDKIPTTTNKRNESDHVYLGTQTTRPAQRDAAKTLSVFNRSTFNSKPSLRNRRAGWWQSGDPRISCQRCVRPHVCPGKLDDDLGIRKARPGAARNLYEVRDNLVWCSVAKLGAADLWRNKVLLVFGVIKEGKRHRLRKITIHRMLSVEISKIVTYTKTVKWRQSVRRFWRKTFKSNLEIFGSYVRHLLILVKWPDVSPTSVNDIFRGWPS